jgi:hypothetical protein
MKADSITILGLGDAVLRLECYEATLA